MKQALVLLALWASLASPLLAKEDVPHIDQCNFCQKCIVDEPMPKPENQVKRHMLQVANDAKLIISSSLLKTTDYSKKDLALLGPIDEDHKRTLPNCTVCRGCNVELTPLSEQAEKVNNVQFNHVSGGSGNWMFKAVQDKNIIVKVHCVPYNNKDPRAPPLKPCDLNAASGRMLRELANYQIAKDCGAADMYPEVWVAQVNAILPGIGYHLRWNVLWMVKVPGIPMYMLQKSTAVKTESLSKMMANLNKTQVHMAGVLDLLTGQCDRNLNNIMVDNDSNIKLIDSMKMLQATAPRRKNIACSHNTAFLPSTRVHTIDIMTWWFEEVYWPLRTEEQHTSELDENASVGCKKVPMAPVAALDYRCHMPNGVTALGKDNYLPQTQKCLAKIAGMSSEEVSKYYSLPLDAAAQLRRNAIDMKDEGFEVTLAQKGKAYEEFWGDSPANKTNFPLQKSCCSFKNPTEDSSVCDTCWKPTFSKDLTEPSGQQLSPEIFRGWFKFGQTHGLLRNKKVGGR